MNLIHFGPDKFNFFPSREYDEIGKDIKPHGLWLSDESTDMGWKGWCEAEEFNLHNLKCYTKFECDISTWCVLSSVKDIEEFNEQYKFKLYPGDKYSQGMNWNKIKEKYNGILITPYQWKLRLQPGFLWYCGWDCASACVWDLSTIKEIKKWNQKHLVD